MCKMLPDLLKFRIDYELAIWILGMVRKIVSVIVLRLIKYS